MASDESAAEPAEGWQRKEELEVVALLKVSSISDASNLQ
jgi:hypothetical protein